MVVKTSDIMSPEIQGAGVSIQSSVCLRFSLEDVAVGSSEHPGALCTHRRLPPDEIILLSDLPWRRGPLAAGCVSVSALQALPR